MPLGRIGGRVFSCFFHDDGGRVCAWLPGCVRQRRVWACPECKSKSFIVVGGGAGACAACAVKGVRAALSLLQQWEGGSTAELLPRGRLPVAARAQRAGNEGLNAPPLPQQMTPINRLC